MTDEQTIRDALADALVTFSDTKWFETYYESPAALDRLIAERDALKEDVVLRGEAARIEAQDALARAEAAEKERDEAQDALQNLAADHYFARAEAAEARISILERQVQNLGALATERQARCATLEAALREAERERHEWEESARRLKWRHDTNALLLAAQAERDDLRRLMREIKHAEERRLRSEGYSESIILAIASAALAATPPAEEEVVAAASVLGLSREETDELVRLVRSEGATTPPAEKEGT